MRNKIVNSNEDKQRIINAMKVTKGFRKQWINEKTPYISEIVTKFPKFIEMPFLVSGVICLSNFVYQSTAK